MVIPSTGTVVLVPFPFSDLSQAKLRPAILLADAGRDDWILCQITSKSYGDLRAIPLNNSDFASGLLQVNSYVRPGKLFTANRSLMVSKIGQLKGQALQQIIDGVIEMLRSDSAP